MPAVGQGFVSPTAAASHKIFCFRSPFLFSFFFALCSSLLLMSFLRSSYSLPLRKAPRVVKMVSATRETPVVRVFIAGGSYTGLSTALNLLDLGQGLSPRMAHNPYEHHPELSKVDFRITIADERDGFCMDW